MFNPFDIFGPTGGDSVDNLSSEANAFVNAIADKESAGRWDVVYTPKGKVKTFSDFSKHPRIYTKIPSGPHKGEYSSAAGKFQITAATYDRVAPLLGITDFTPASQKKIAWYLAQEKVPSLQQILETGDKASVQAAARKLSGVWTSLEGGIEDKTSDEGFYDAYDKYFRTGESMVPPAGMPSDLDTAVLSYVDYGRGPLAGRLPTDLKRMSQEAVTRHQSVVDTVSKLMRDGIVVPDGTRDLKNTASTVIDFPSADLIAAGVNSMGMTSIPADPKGPLPRPSPLAPWGNRPTVAGTVVSPGVIDVGGAVDSSSLKAGAPTSFDSSYPKIKTPYSTLDYQKKTPLSPKVNPTTAAGKAFVSEDKPKSGQSVTPAPVPPPMSVNDQKLVQMVKMMQTPVKAPSIEKSAGIAGTAELPKGYKPPAGIIPGTTAKPATTKSETKSSTSEAPYRFAPVMTKNSAGQPIATMKQATIAAVPSKAAAVPNPVQKATGANTNAPVSLSNPVLQPVKTQPKSAAVTQTVSKPLPADVLKTVEKVLATPTVQQKGVVEAKPKATATPAWGATVPKFGAPAAKPVTQTVTAKPVVKVSAPLKKTGMLESGSVLKKTLAAAPAGKVVTTDLKDLNPDGTAKVGGAVTKTKQPLSPLDILGDLFLNGGGMTAGLIGGALMGNKPRDTQQASRTQTLADMAAGKPVTVIDRIKAETGQSSAQAYETVRSNTNKGAGGYTSSGESKTTTSGESWAANFGDG